MFYRNSHFILETAKNVSSLTRFFRAALKNLCGDHEEWLSFEKKMIQSYKRAKQAKTSKKKAAEIKHVEGIRRDLQAKESELRAQAQSSEPKVTRPTLVSTRNNSSPGMSTDEPSDNKPSVSAREEKEMKQKRHEVNEKAREEKKLIKSEPIESCAATSSSNSAILTSNDVEQKLPTIKQR